MKKSRPDVSRVTLKDIAESLGLSKATVSLAINGSRLVAEKTRERVLQKVDELGYVYNLGAASLSTGESQTVGVAVHDISNPFFVDLFEAIEAELGLKGRLAYLCNTDESLERQSRFVDSLVQHNADGLIICPAVGTEAQHVRPISEKRIPTVLISRRIEGVNLDFVGNDEELLLRMATGHLIGLGHTRIAMLGAYSQSTAGRARRAGYEATMVEAGLTVDPDWFVNCATNAGGGEQAMKQALDQKNKPTAVVCLTDHLALGAISTLYGLGLKPGVDMAVMGCDGIDEGERAYARLSTVRVQKRAMGQLAAEILMRRVHEPDLPLQHTILEPTLVIRDSCGSHLKT